MLKCEPGLSGVQFSMRVFTCLENFARDLSRQVINTQRLEIKHTTKSDGRFSFTAMLPRLYTQLERCTEEVIPFISDKTTRRIDKRLVTGG